MATDTKRMQELMLATVENRGKTNERLDNIEKMLGNMDKKLSKVADRMSMAQGGWVALMAIVGIITSAGGVLLGIYKMFFQRGAA